MPKINKRAIACAVTLLMVFTGSLMCATDSNVDGEENANEANTIDFAQFLANVQNDGSGNYSYDGNGITVKWSPSSACTNNTHTVDTCPNNLAKPDGNNPQRCQSPNVQYQIFKDGVNVTISNTNFEFVPADFSMCANNKGDWVGKYTENDGKNAELQLLNSGNVTFSNCSFKQTIVSPFGNNNSRNGGNYTSITECTFENTYNTYSIKDVYTENLTVDKCTFNNGSGGIYLEGPVKKGTISIANNTFIDMDKNCATGKENSRGLIQFYGDGDYSATNITITGNTSNNDAPVIRQLSMSMTDTVLSVSQILYENQFQGEPFTREKGNVKYYNSSASANGDGTQTSPYNTIASAINAIPMGGTIVVMGEPGHTLDLSNASKSLSLVAEFGCKVEGTIKFGPGIGYLKISGFEFTGNATVGNYDNGDYSAMNLVIENCKFDKACGNCVYIQPEIRSLKIVGSTFTAPNVQYQGQYLVWAYQCKSLFLERNEFDGKGVTRGAVHLGDGHSEGTDAHVQNNKFTGFERVFMIAFVNSDEINQVDICNNTFSNISHSTNSTKGEHEFGVLFLHKNLIEGTSVIFSSNKITGCTQLFYSENKTIDPSAIIAQNGYKENTVDGIDPGSVEKNTYDL